MATPDENGSFTLDFGKLDYTGKACLKAALCDRATRENRGSRTLDLKVLVPERDKRLFVKENGVVLKDGKPFAVLGSPGGLRIISSVAQVISKIIIAKIWPLPTLTEEDYNRCKGE